jgi:hypothetical protein
MSAFQDCPSLAPARRTRATNLGGKTSCARSQNQLADPLLIGAVSSLRAVAAQLAAEGHTSRKGVPFLAAQVGRMLANVEAQRSAA